MLKSFRYLLFPFSILYGLGVRIRNRMFDKKIFRSAEFNFPVICVGNLAVGGTGKTPMVEYLVELISPKYKTATLSRGYKRKTKGFAIAGSDTTAVEIGDEPMQIHIKHPDVIVAVSEERVIGIPQLLHEIPEVEAIILDDAFQHREVTAGLNILLTAFSNLYTRDILLPAGDLRDTRSSSQRADIIIITKCKSSLSESERKALIKEISPLQHQSVYFTKIQYSAPYHLFHKTEKIPLDNTGILLVCGIANPEPLKTAIETIVNSYEALFFRDHHIFDTTDIKEIRKRFDEINAGDKMIITTEKDAVRLLKYQEAIADLPIYVWPMQHRFLFDQGEQFNGLVMNFIQQF